MARGLSASMLTEVDAASLRPVLFYEGVFTGGTLRLWSGLGSISWNSQTWTGAGSLLGISDITETADLRAEGITLSLSGLPSSLISTALSQAQLGLAGTVWLGAIDASGNVIVDPYLAFKGKLDVPIIDDDGETCTISVSYEHQLIDLERPRIRRWTHEDQQIDYPGDMGFQYVSELQDQAVVW